MVSVKTPIPQMMSKNHHQPQPPRAAASEQKSSSRTRCKDTNSSSSKRENADKQKVGAKKSVEYFFGSFCMKRSSSSVGHL